MSQLEGIWGKRIKDYWNMAIRYLRLIGNSGFLFAIYIAIVAGSYYYSELLKWLPKDFPAVLFLSVIFAFLLTRSSLRTFLKAGDIVFLSPIEGRLSNYFRYSYIYSLILQSFIIILIVVLLTPMYRFFIQDDTGLLLFIIVALLISKGWNLFAQWEEERLLYRQVRFFHKFTRFLLNFSFAYFLFVGATIYFVLAIFFLKVLLVLFYYQHLKKQHSLKWDHLIEVEEQSVMAFYRMANMFTDVPKLSTKVKKRSLISWLPEVLPFSQKSTFKYLYLKSFFRANDYFGIYARLLLIGSVLIVYVQIDYGKLFVASLFLYMSALQLSTLINHHGTKIWLDLYPINKKVKINSFIVITFILLIVKASIFALVTLIVTSGIETVYVFIAGMLISYVFSFYVLKRRLYITT